MRTSVVVAALCATLVSAPLSADFTYRNFFLAKGLSLNNDAYVNGDTLVVTPDFKGQSGSSFYLDPQKLSDGFDTTFVVNISGKGGKFGMGDGMAFVIQSSGSDYLGDGGGGLGYQGSVVGLAIEIDTWPEATDEIAVHGTLNDPQLGCWLSSDDGTEFVSVQKLTIKDGNDHTVRVSYVPGSLSVYLDGAREPLFTLGLDLAFFQCQGTPLLDRNGAAWIGFTGATGGATELNAVKSWTFSNTVGPGCTTIPGDIAAADCMALNGNAGPIDGGGLRVTPAAKGQAGSAWAVQKQRVRCGFDTLFTVQMSGGADGMAFVLQDEGLNALGGGGSGLGYGSNGPTGITRSVAIEFDTFSFPGEIPASHVSVQTNGVGPNDANDAFSIGAAVLGTNIDDDAPHVVRVIYHPGSMAIYIDGSPTPTLAVAIDLGNIGGSSIMDNDGMMWMGFTGGTGSLYESQDVLQWSFSTDGGSIADLNGDCAVDGADLGALLGAWGPGTGPADLNGDGAVDGADLGQLLGDWGS